MMSRIVLCALAMVSVAAEAADGRIQEAVDDVIRNSSLSSRRVAQSVPGWGLPTELTGEPAFSSLVGVVRSRIGECTLSLVGEMTNDVRREVFLAALAQCGQEVYRDAVVRWFGGAVPSGISPVLVEEFVSPSSTCMEGYFILHYGEPGISNVWANVRALYLLSGDAASAAGVDEILSGKAKAQLEAMSSLE